MTSAVWMDRRKDENCVMEVRCLEKEQAGVAIPGLWCRGEQKGVMPVCGGFLVSRVCLRTRDIVDVEKQTVELFEEEGRMQCIGVYFASPTATHQTFERGAGSLSGQWYLLMA